MKVKLTDITLAIMDDKEKFAQNLNDSLNDINNMAHTREMSIFGRLDELSTQIDNWGTSLSNQINATNRKLNAVLRISGIDPDLLTEE